MTNIEIQKAKEAGMRIYLFSTPVGMKDITAGNINQAQEIADIRYGGGNARKIYK